MKHKISPVIASIFIIAIILSNFASAGFAVGFPYKIDLKKGETYDGSFQLQNIIQPVEQITVEIIIEQGEEYLSFPDGTTIQLAANEIKNIPVKISVPNNADGGDVYNAKIIFKPVSGDVQEGGTVNFRLSVGRSFDIEVIKETNTILVIAIVFLILAILILILILLKTLKNKK